MNNLLHFSVFINYKRKNAHQMIRVFRWSGRRVSNPLPAAWKAAALPNELLPQVKTFPQSLWGRVDSNHRTPKRTDLQSVAIAAMRLPQNLRADRRTRTADRLITNQLLYQLSYIGLGLRLSFK